MTDRRLDRIDNTVNARQQGIMVLEDVWNPHNAEAIFRSCDAFGIQDIYLIFDKQDPFDPKEIGNKTSSSANKWLDFTIFHSTEACINQLHDDGYSVVGTVLSDRTESIYDIDMSDPKLALMLGNEHRGLSDTAIEMVDHHIMIPMLGMVQSLNVSVTAAICLYEINRQRMEAGMHNYLISEEKRAKLFKSFQYRR